MREILFRGKKQNGEWLYGDLVHYDDKILIFSENAQNSPDYYEVKPETVGQLLYTDKGKKYFNGDIFKHEYYPDFFCRVYFSEELLAVVGQIYDKDGEYELVTILPSDFKKRMELVGNIHENTKH